MAEMLPLLAGLAGYALAGNPPRRRRRNPSSRIHEVRFSTDRKGRQRAHYWSPYPNLRWLPIGYDRAKLMVATGQATEATRRNPSSVQEAADDLLRRYGHQAPGWAADGAASARPRSGMQAFWLSVERILRHKLQMNPRRGRRNPDDHMAAANAIKDQIGPRALFMLGAKQLAGGSDTKGRPYLSFRVGRNEKGVTHVIVYLDPSDTYAVQFIAARGTKSRVVSTVSDIYVDALHQALEHGTGMYTSLGTLRGNPCFRRR